ncbi:hypothetical protein ABZ957_10660 [Streptomyces sp. NPDC046316]
MGGRQTRSRQCKQCHRPLGERRWRRPKRFCTRRHQIRYWLEELADALFS